MDLYLSGARASLEEREAVDQILGPPVSQWEGGVRLEGSAGQAAQTGHEARGKRHLLLPALHGVQSRVGHLTPGALNYVCQRLNLPPAEAYGVASFYAMFSLEPRPAAVVHVCDDIACRVLGGETLCETLEKDMGPSGSAGEGRRESAWVRSPCLGMCDRGPAALVTIAGRDPREFTLTPATAHEVQVALRSSHTQPEVSPRIPQFGQKGLRLLRRIGKVDPTKLDDYRAHGGYRALRKALEMGPAGVLREINESKLKGRGGAAFPTGIKWGAVAGAPERPHYLVCNADESEPGTFKDRVLMEGDPFAILEAMTIAGHATGCEKGFLYIRGEYPLATDRLSRAIREAHTMGFLGESVMGQDFRFDIELRRGAGAYICGEETALFNSIEGFRGEPRNKPPFPTTHGLFGKPTVVNNVETLANVPDIVLEGGRNFAATGTPDSTGTRLFCLSGHVKTPGLYEVEMGTSLRELLKLAGGASGQERIQAILLGGAAGSFLGPAQDEISLSFEGTREAGTTLGSGVVMVFDSSVDIPDILLRIASFFRDESCGQCVPCRVGTVRQEEALHRLLNRTTSAAPEQETELLSEIAQVMRDASICGLGQTAASAIQSAMNLPGLRNIKRNGKKK